MKIFDYIAKKREERRREDEKMLLMAELQKVRRMIKAAEYAFDYALEKEDIDRSIAVISENQRKYTQIYSKLRRLG
ncbi:MAG: hypothetical protein IJE51_00325 [Clostridia bacterium]|nr:hypothetical protein [Clostridia bacterium]